MLGKTKLHHVIWKGMLWPPRTYFQSEPTETRKNHMERPHSQRETRRETILMMPAAFETPRKSGGSIESAWLPSWAAGLSVRWRDKEVR